MMSAAAHWLMKRVRGLIYLILPPLEVHSARKKLEKRSSNSEELSRTDQRYCSWYAISVEKLDELIKAESDRAAKLDDKAGKISAVLVLALTIGGAFGTSLIDTVSRPKCKAPMRFGLLLSVVYILLGGWLAFRSGSAAKPQGGYGPDWETLLSGNSSQNKEPRVEALVSFEFANLISNNNISGALDCVRNGIVIFFVLLLVVLLDRICPTQKWAYVQWIAHAPFFCST
jgi:hypothetical protein